MSMGAALASVGVCTETSLRAEAAPRAEAGAQVDADFETRAMSVEGKHANRFELLIPRHGEGPLAILVALHGLGESFAEEQGARAWLDRYGLGTSYARLRAPPLARTQKRNDWTDERLREVNRSLAAAPFAGIAVVCPFTPNFRAVADKQAATAEYGDWLVGSVLPAAREALAKRAPASGDRARFGIDGCSMGGPLALSVAIAHAKTFGSVGTTQGAFGEHRAASFAQGIAKANAAHGALRVHVLSSEGDSFLPSARALARELGSREVEHRLRVIPGPHDQPWLREAGTIEMLLAHERPVG
jgi:dienelactone hydrolase